ncbi:LysR family transcriptional regulator [Paracoccus seriniphilus]|uniref:DNA-binding transcriptional regulator, LysR family n=1 Tax=Paracoccus seriniphilus TaxID=184748 RepID=A0A239PZV3_9RHOB|nr:LysR family transcriptional regulator [Paracoccus seriniphilus]WCR15712.1 LysR family transcriptional regulator [Paracoccus seriniphilus]SNT75608.1 DNA-binding transcriptional regulator, LysR family [Paracoccus seriniphilus]
MTRFSNLNGILAFVTVAREGSVSRAAEVLNLTQPAISHQIRKLSEETGIVLFNRTSRGLVLTPDGVTLLPRARQVLAAMTEFQRSASKQCGQVSGMLKIGTIVDPEFIRLGRLLGRLGAAHPGITTELIHGVSGEILAKLKRQQIDAGFYLTAPDEVDRLASDRPLYSRKLAEFTYRVIAPAGWERHLSGANWAQVAALPWIGTSPQSVHNRLLTRIFAGHGCVQNAVALVDHEASMTEMVLSGVGLSLCRESIALHHRQAYGLAVSEELRVPACLVFLTLLERKEDPVIAALLDQIEDIW